MLYFPFSETTPISPLSSNAPTVDTKKPAIKQVFYLIDPFEVREVLQGEDVIVFKHDKLSQSL